MDLREQLTRIYEANGKLTPQIVVDAARSAEHPLHSRFEWNDQVAGEQYRKTQAGELIRSVKVEWVDGAAVTEPIRAFHSITRADGTSYEPIERVAQDDFARTLLLRQAERDWRALYRRYAHLAEFLDLVRRDTVA